MTPSSVPRQPAGDPPSRRGRRPEAIGDDVGDAHRAWLEPVRSRLFASGLTLDDLVSRSGYSKARISELLRGKGYYPGWEITYSVVRALDIPVWPMRRLWRAAAMEAKKTSTWIENRIQDVQPLGPEEPPVAHRGLVETMLRPYTAYARAFLQADWRAHSAVLGTFDILWLTWDDAAASAGTPRHAWCLLRSRVLAGAARRRRDDRPDLRAAAFSTVVAQSEMSDPDAHLSRIGALIGFFDAISELPEDQMDVIVLRHLCGVRPDAIPGIIGLSPAVTRTIHHHARGALEEIYRHHDEPGVISPR